MNVEGKASLLRKIASRSFKKSDTKEPAAYLPLRKRAPNEVVDGYIHMPHEVVSLTSSNESMTLIQGVICLSVNRPIDVERLDVNVRGEASTRFFDGQPQADNPDDEGIVGDIEPVQGSGSGEGPLSRIKSKLGISTPTSLSKKTITFLNIHQPILRSDLTHKPILETRCHYVPFEFCVVESRLPPSFTGRHGSIKYYVEATLTSPDLPLSYMTRFTFLVRRCNSVPGLSMITVPSHYRSLLLNNVLYKFVIPTLFFPKEKYAQVKLDVWRLRPGAPLPTTASFYIREEQTYK
ncbi:hypothetical protein DSO57_1019674 [Entomophthora muscae]|uniref:Uncharacterized protein n=1 Tax=Entomophthora muscae TaxID=34485 RepID=A0ACC2RIM6_9FUNG|nr:hypothetical protein DSO57_1019674 [Entomophthora muscae]